MQLQRRGALLLAFAAASLAATGAGAHDLTCRKTVNGHPWVVVSTYPTVLHYEFTLFNLVTDRASVATSISDPLLSPFGFSWSTPVSVPAGGSVSKTFDVTIDSFGMCEQFGGTAPELDSIALSPFFDNMLHVVFDSGEALCSARVYCHPPEETDGGTTDGGTTDGGTSDGGTTDGGTTDGGTTDGGTSSGATRTMGFFKTHESALTQCLASGPVNLGFITISTLSQALGMLWGDPPRFGNGTTRSTLDKDRFILGRQELVAICNERLFGTTSSVIADALAALGSTRCGQIEHFVGLVDGFNNSGDSIDFPSGFSPGPATPADAKSKAVDPTSPSGLSCTP